MVVITQQKIRIDGNDADWKRTFQKAILTISSSSTTTTSTATSTTATSTGGGNGSKKKNDSTSHDNTNDNLLIIDRFTLMNVDLEQVPWDELLVTVRSIKQGWEMNNTSSSNNEQQREQNSSSSSPSPSPSLSYSYPIFKSIELINCQNLEYGMEQILPSSVLSFQSVIISNSNSNRNLELSKDFGTVLRLGLLENHNNKETSSTVVAADAASNDGNNDICHHQYQYQYQNVGMEFLSITSFQWTIQSMEEFAYGLATASSSLLELNLSYTCWTTSSSSSSSTSSSSIADEVVDGQELHCTNEIVKLFTHAFNPNNNDTTSHNSRCLLRKLTLNRCFFQDKELAYMIRYGLSNVSTLRHLYLGGNSLGPHTMSSLSKWLSSTPTSSSSEEVKDCNLETLGLSHPCWSVHDDDSTPFRHRYYIDRLLPSILVNQSLRTLHLASNHINDEQLNDIVQVLMVQRQQRQQRQQQSNSTRTDDNVNGTYSGGITMLDLKSNDITDSGAKILAKYFSNVALPPSTTTIASSSTSTCSSNDYLTSSSSPSSYTNNTTSSRCLQKLWLTGNNKIGTDGAKCILDAISKTSTSNLSSVCIFDIRIPTYKKCHCIKELVSIQKQISYYLTLNLSGRRILLLQLLSSPRPRPQRRRRRRSCDTTNQHENDDNNGSRSDDDNNDKHNKNDKNKNNHNTSAYYHYFPKGLWSHFFSRINHHISFDLHRTYLQVQQYDDINNSQKEQLIKNDMIYYFIQHGSTYIFSN